MGVELCSCKQSRSDFHRQHQEKLTTLKFSDFNLGDHKVYSMLAPYKYLTITKGRNPNIFPQQWTHNLV